MRQMNTKKMLDYWLDLFWQAGNSGEAHGPIIWPERSDIQPSECRTLLSNTFILEQDGPNVEYRLAGTGLCGMYGRELKQETFAEAFVGEDQRSADSWAYRIGLDDYIVLICSVGQTASGRTINLETLLLPLNHHGKAGDRVLGITTPCENPVWLGIEPIVEQSIRSVRILRPWEDPLYQDRSEPHSTDAPPAAAAHHPRTGQPMATRRSDLNAPSIFADNGTPGAEIASLHAPRRVGHLTIIDGGRN